MNFSIGRSTNTVESSYQNFANGVCFPEILADRNFVDCAAIRLAFDLAKHR